MTIIYQPREIINVYEEIGGGIVGALVSAAVDFISGTNKPWSYYLGVGIGTMALATGIPGAAATIYAIGDTVDAVLFKSPDGSLVRVYLNGILQASVDTYAVGAVWEALNINGLVGGQVNRIDIVNFGVSPNEDATGIPWLAIGPITINGASAYAIGATTMDTLAIRIRDAETDSPDATIPIYLASGLTLAQVQTYADAILPEIDALTEGQIVEASITFNLTLVGGLKSTPDALSLNERGGLITFDTTGPRADSVRIPAMQHTIMGGDSFNLEDDDVAALITRLLTATTAATIRPRTSQDYQFSAARSGKKSLRRK
jgi:hypothetical protein